jgi:hypothetical protein
MELSALNYLNDLLKSKRPVEENPSSDMSTLLSKKIAIQRPQQKKRGGIQDALTAERVETANFLNVPLLQVAGLTRDWTTEELYRLRRESQSFTKNPRALWWKLYKQRNNEKRKNRNNKDICRVRKERGKQDKTSGQRTLF